MNGIKKNIHIIVSLLIHMSLIGVCAGIFFLKSTEKQKAKKTIQFEVIKVPKTASDISHLKPLENIGKDMGLAPEKSKAPKAPKKIQKPTQPVTAGVTKSSLKSQGSKAPQIQEGSAAGVEIKRGETVVPKSEGLPQVTAEYLVSEMPVVKRRERIQYPENAKKIKLEGIVVLDILIDTVGAVRDVKVVEGLLPEMDKEAVRAIKLYKFKPARIDKTPVAVRIRYEVKFVLEQN